MKIYVGNLAWTATKEDLKNLFAKYGTVEEAAVVSDRETGRSRGFGFIQMPNAAEAQKAIEGLNGADFMGRSLRVNEARTQPDRPERPERRGGFGRGPQRSGPRANNE